MIFVSLSSFLVFYFHLMGILLKKIYVILSTLIETFLLTIRNNLFLLILFKKFENHLKLLFVLVIISTEKKNGSVKQV